MEEAPIQKYEPNPGAVALLASRAEADRYSDGAAEAEGVGVFAEGGDAEGDVLFEGDA